MKSKYEIEMDFSRAISQAQELEELSRELNTMATEHIRTALRILFSGWQGDSALIYQEKGEALTNDMLDTADDLIRVAKNIKSTANVVYTAEKAALQLGF